MARIKPYYSGYKSGDAFWGNQMRSNEWTLRTYWKGQESHVVACKTGDQCKTKARGFWKLSQKYLFKIYDPSGELWAYNLPNSGWRIRWIYR